MVIKSWQVKWVTLSAYCRYPYHVRTAIYTTNAVEAVHRQLHKLKKAKGGFDNENALLNLIYPEGHKHAGILKAFRALDPFREKLESDIIASDDPFSEPTGRPCQSLADS